MIVIKIEMWPGGDRERAYVLATGAIVNKGGTRELGNYEFGLNLKRKAAWRLGEVRRFPRLKKNVWYLLREVLAQL